MTRNNKGPDAARPLGGEARSRVGRRFICAGKFEDQEGLEMALFDGLLRSNVVTGLAFGIGAAVVAPVVVPAVARAAKPLAKAAIKGGLMLYVRGRETLAELGEVAEDVYAEATSEFAQEMAPKSAGEEAMAEAAAAAANAEGT